MKLAETRLRHIVLEEVASRLLDIYIEQEIERLIAEGAVDDWKAEKWKATKKKIRNAALGAGALGAIVGGLGGQISDYEDTRAAKYAADLEASIEKNSTMEKGASEIERLVNAVDTWSWEAGPPDERTGFAGPLPNDPEDGSQAIMPPDWSVAIQALSDKKAGTPQYEIDREVLRMASTESDISKHYTGQRGRDPSRSAERFFKDYPSNSYPYSDASDVGMHAFRSNVPMMPSAVYKAEDGSHGLQNIVYIPFDEIKDDYVLPLTGMTKEQLYKKYYYGIGANREEFKKLKGSLQENRITWKNYKNRKKVLA